MSSFRKYEIIEQSSPLFIKKTSILSPKTLAMSLSCYLPPSISVVDDQHLDCSLDIFKPPTCFDFPTFPFDSYFENASTDLVQIERTPFSSTCKRLQLHRNNRCNDFYLQTLCDRVTELESKFDHLVTRKEEKEKEKKNKKKEKVVNRKYTWTAEIKDGDDRKYKWMTEIKGGEYGKKKKKEEVVIGKMNYKWVAEIEGKNDEKRTYTWKTTIGAADDKEVKKDKKKGKKEKGEKASNGTRIVEIEETDDHGAAILRQAFARRDGGAHAKGKKKELSPQDAAMMIQMTFRAYLICRSQALRALRDLAVAKTKLKEIRKLFDNFSYRNRVARDAEERQKFSEKIIVLLLTVDAVEGVDVMVRAAKRSMVDELEAMLDVVDPHPGGKKSFTRRRTFDMPSGEIRQDIAEGVAQVVGMLDEENDTSEASS